MLASSPLIPLQRGREDVSPSGGGKEEEKSNP